MAILVDGGILVISATKRPKEFKDASGQEKSPLFTATFRVTSSDYPVVAIPLSAKNAETEAARRCVKI